MLPTSFPTPASEYHDPTGASLLEVLRARAAEHPVNLIFTLLFLGAIVHTFVAPLFAAWSRRVEHRYQSRLTPAQHGQESMLGNALEFLGEVEAVFALWAIPVLAVACSQYGGERVTHFLHHGSPFTEALFVVVIMAMAATRPVVKFAERCLGVIARLGHGTPTAWWWAILTMAPLLGSVITEPGAMTIGAMLLSRKFYELQPSRTFKYATLGLLFVNVSVGGVLTNFAAPPVIMVAGPERWNWSSLYMFSTFGVRAVAGILLSTTLYWLLFRGALRSLATAAGAEKTEQPAIGWIDDGAPVPWLVTVLHLAFMAWTVLVMHHPPLFIGGYIFFLALVHTTKNYQTQSSFRGPLMVGFFLAGLVVHGRLQAWWLEPVLQTDLSAWVQHLGATILTGFNDNALITFLASQAHCTPAAQYAIMSGAVAGGGLTVIANAPNPAGQSLLKRYFPHGVSALGLFLAALLPTTIVVLVFMLTRP